MSRNIAELIQRKMVEENRNKIVLDQQTKNKKGLTSENVDAVKQKTNSKTTKPRTPPKKESCDEDDAGDDAR